MRQSFFDKERQETEPIKQEPPKPPTYLNPKEERGYLCNYDNNNLIKALKSIFPKIKDIEQRAKTYGIGTGESNFTIFYQIDQNKKIRGGKLMLYDEVTAKRVKDNPNAFNWIHTQRKLKDYHLKQCLFGLHLTQDNNKPICIVESEKTAFICSLFDNEKIFVATGGKANFNYEMLSPLIGKTLTAYPDSGEFEIWKERAERLKDYDLNINVSNLFEDYPKGTDLADLIISKQQEEKEEQTKEKEENKAVNEVKEPPNIKLYTLKEMKDLAELIIPGQDQRSEKDFLKALNQLENLTPTQGKELINKMILNDIISRTSLKNYYLFHSTPY